MAKLDLRMRTMDRWGLLAHTPTPFSPVVDGEVLPTDPWTGLAAGAGRDVPLLVGHNRDEWRLFLVIAGRAGTMTDEMATTAMQVFGPGPDAPARMRAAFPDADAEELYVLVRSDRMFRIPSLHLAAAQTAGGGRSHLYELTWPAPASAELGACHGLDVPLVFGSARTRAWPACWSATHRRPRRSSSRPRCRAPGPAFARDGEPGWAPYDEDAAADPGVRRRRAGGVRPYPEEASRRLWAGTAFTTVDLRR